jgi:hypothetical protein
MDKKNIISAVIGFVICAALLQFCEGPKKEDRVVTKTKVVKVIDTLKIKGGIVTKYKQVFVRKTDTSIVYLDKPDTTSICANYYEQPIIGKRSSGIARITTTGELVDFSATIECQDSITETTITKYRDKSQLFLSGEYNTSRTIQLGVDYNIKNTILLKAGAGYNFESKVPHISLGVGIPIF